jgi:hypothetical protein
MKEGVMLERAVFEFTQEANCTSTEEYESLTIECDSSLGIDRDEDCFFILKTEGWAIDSVEDLQKLFDRIKKVVIKEKKVTYVEALKNDKK